ncbi:LPP20 family lipoprotein [Campylobacter sp. IFREMER_LSEM_CL2127]|uniref:LPP20 family lipoprotein n=1 Tax=Campylobacter sp. IFREMER_LSEM_CL2127 TaxID=2911619 RepID=UPI0021E9A51E|nr:LPP20 family lipoprotein [Campylobacter sp. IFREMER_LSEM_CL2127]MCV3381119.1 LPP20 family lipoprotein [Campylobacter sp. IFREMER_LSEM_CL2127]HEC1766580.1 hypothetical protein [Campylobacter lari]
MNILKSVILILFLFLNLEAKVVTSVNTKSSTGEGSGLTREEAINNALIEAIGKINGVNINSLKQTFVASYSDNQNTNIVDMYKEKIIKATKGEVDSYDVNNVIKDENGNYIAEVTVYKTSVKKYYDIPGYKPDSRRSITVFNSSSQNKQLGDVLQQKIITNLLQSRKFNVLDRDSKGYYEMEKALITSDPDVQKDEIYKLKNVLATDYILLFHVGGVDLKTKGNKNKIDVVVDYRVLLFATRQIKFSNTLTMSAFVKGDSLVASEKLSEKIAKKISDDILNAIYPLKVAQVSNNEVVFSQTLSNDEIYECYSLGEVIKDAYTKENTARIETKSGKVQIIRSTPKLSYAKILEGSVKKDDICRPLDDSGVGMEKQHSVNPNGTVNLGW